MGNAIAGSYSAKYFQLILRGRRTQGLLQTDDDWRALGDIVTRMLFWCGGSVHGCRCEANQMRFAVRAAHAPIGAIARHISGAYAIRMRRIRGWRGGIFKHYVAHALSDESLFHDLVSWLHRPAGPHVWTGAAAFLTPHSSGWITNALPISAPDILHGPRPGVETIARAVADHCGVSFEDMRSTSRKRRISRAKVIATVLCTRNGATAAAAARLFHRSRSTLVERADHYRRTQPQIFADAERALSVYLDNKVRTGGR